MTYPCIGIPLLVSLLYFNCAAQSPAVIRKIQKEDSSRIFYLPANKMMTQAQWRDSIYRFPSFAQGQITFASGFSPKDQLRMNYNLYFMQMDYISTRGDTLQIKPSAEFKLITLNDHVFLYDVKIGYIEIILQLPVSLGTRSMMIVRYIDDLEGGHNRYTGFAPFGNQDQRGASIRLDRYYQKGGDYFFIDKDGNPFRTSSSSILKLFREHRKAVKSYIDKHNVDFDNREQLIDLLEYCNGLNQPT
jgi:hypothetical protein